MKLNDQGKSIKVFFGSIALLVTQSKYDFTDRLDDWFYLISQSYSEENYECFWDNMEWSCPDLDYFYEWAMERMG